MAINDRRCPACGSVNAVRIVYGFPTQAAERQAKAGKIRLGGFRINDGVPDYCCRDCGHEWNRQDIKSASYSHIRRVRACVGSDFTGYKDVSIDFFDGILAWDHYGDRETEHFVKKVSEPALERFRRGLTSLAILDWKSSYVLPDILAGTKWSLELVRDGRNVRKYGSNAYPHNWEAFCRLLSHVSGREFG